MLLQALPQADSVVSCTVRGISKETGAVLYETPIKLPKNQETVVNVSDYEKADAVKGYTRISDSRKVTAAENGQISSFDT